jgi:hypothetical protein
MEQAGEIPGLFFFEILKKFKFFESQDGDPAQKWD